MYALVTVYGLNRETGNKEEYSCIISGRGWKDCETKAGRISRMIDDKFLCVYRESQGIVSSAVGNTSQTSSLDNREVYQVYKCVYFYSEKEMQQFLLDNAENANIDKNYVSVSKKGSVLSVKGQFHKVLSEQLKLAL